MYSTMLPCSTWNDRQERRCTSSSIISNVNCVKQYYNHFMVNCTLGYKILQNNERSYWGKTVPSQTLCLGRHDAVYSGFDSSGGPNDVSLTWDTNSVPSPQLLPDLVSIYSIFLFYSSLFYQVDTKEYLQRTSSYLWSPGQCSFLNQ